MKKKKRVEDSGNIFENVLDFHNLNTRLKFFVHFVVLQKCFYTFYISL